MSGRAENSREAMLVGTIELGAEVGLESFTIKKLATHIGMAPGSIYSHFESKDELLEEAFYRVDRHIAALYEGFGLEVSGENTKIDDTIRFLLERYLDFLIAHPDETLFYFRFRTSPRYTEQVQDHQFEYFQGFLGIVNMADAQLGFLARIPWDVLWVYVLDTTLSFASRVITGGIDNSEANRSAMIDLIVCGLDTMIGNGATEF